MLHDTEYVSELGKHGSTVCRESLPGPGKRGPGRCRGGWVASLVYHVIWGTSVDSGYRFLFHSGKGSGLGSKAILEACLTLLCLFALFPVQLHSRKLTWKPKRVPRRTTVPLKEGYVGFHVSLASGMTSRQWI